MAPREMDTGGCGVVKRRRRGAPGEGLQLEALARVEDLEGF